MTASRPCLGTALIAFVAGAAVVAACGSGNSNNPTCSGPQVCVLVPEGGSQEMAACLTSCLADAGSCQDGEVCTHLTGCCSGSACTATLQSVCCPPSGC